ncbi:MAG: DUF4234 domain-containing protein [Stackebrandtia sp.]
MTFSGSASVPDYSPAATQAQPPRIQAPAALRQSGVRLGKTRSPAGVWVLSIVTLGVYGFVWHYKVNRELCEYNGQISVSPGLALCNVTIFALLTAGISAAVSFFRTGSRVNQAMASCYAGRCSGAAGLALQVFVFGVGVAYYQKRLNRVWAAHGQS